jgi:DNA topoisomerase-1
VSKVGGKFVPSEIGLVVTDLLVDNFKDIFDLQYTARLEEELDEIEEGKEKWTDALAGFYTKFEKDLHYAEKHMENIKRMEKPTDERCERCGSPLVIKWGKHGSFFACSSYDKNDPNSCTFTRENPIDLPDLDTADMQETSQEEYCENCGRPMVLKRGRFGQFMACTGYPDCKTTRRLDQQKKVPDIPLEEKCPQCGRNMVLRHGRYGEFTSCSGYPDCKYVKQNFIGVKCPECKDGELVEKRARKRGTTFLAVRIIPNANSLRRSGRWPKVVPNAAMYTWCKSTRRMARSSPVRNPAATTPGPQMRRIRPGRLQASWFPVSGLRWGSS